MNTIECKFCGRCANSAQVINAHTCLTKENDKTFFASTDDTLGIDFCQICHVPVDLPMCKQRIWGILSVVFVEIKMLVVRQLS